MLSVHQGLWAAALEEKRQAFHSFYAEFAKDLERPTVCASLSFQDRAISHSLSLRFLLPPSPHSALSLFHTYACVRIRHFPKTCQYRNGGCASDGRRSRQPSERKSWSGTESVQRFTNVLRGCKCNCTPEPIRPRHRPRHHPHHRVVIRPGAAMQRRSPTWSRRGVVGLMKRSKTAFLLRPRCATRTDRPAGTML